MVNRIVVGAHYGLTGWLAQRITAVVMALYTLLVAAVFLFARPTDYASWKGLFAQGWMRIATLLFFASLFAHAWIGVRDILMDYVKPTGLRLVLEVLVILGLVAYGLWTVQILWRP
ncbi:MAG: succinate dehydrogenase, hydrophobic membrane anchor protein [Burkholderiales bacterium]|jgi:succinate dehydrogenase / fumarate reductase membrane anchor subunit|nr:succinate dehydrogenase, hydrophobic membrane anchor protein [Burkholderiales bacterium]